MPTSERVEEIVAELERAGEALVDLAMDLLRESLEAASDAAAATRQEKVVNRARSSVEKAVALLRSVSAAGSERDEDL
ncbi:MAG: hypothetical protein M0Z69_02750 [Actinomycetota bacterium]|nr:hypothetical protein [Actinomycetota bacterium]